jgi:hypothetical protein
VRSKAWPRISVLGPHPYCRFRAATDVVMPDELATSASGIEGATWHGSWHEREDFPGSRRGWRPAIGAARRERRFESCRGHRLCLAQTAVERQARTQVEQLNGQYRPEKWSAERRSCWHSRGL